MDFENNSRSYFDAPFDPSHIPAPDVPPLQCPDFDDLAQKISNAMEFCRLLEVRFENMQHHGTPTAEVYDFTSRKRLY